MRSYWDRDVAGYGRVRVPTGARDRREHDACLRLAARLVQDGQADIVDAVILRQVTLAHLVQLDRRGHLGWALADVRLAANLWTAVDAYFPPEPGRRQYSTRERYRRSFARLKTLGVLPPEASVRSLATVDWASVRHAWGKSASDWMHLRRAISRLLSLALRSKSHPFRDQVLFGFPTRPVRPRIPDAELPDIMVAKLPPLILAVVTLLAILGLRPGELWRCKPEHWRSERRQLRVPGTKTEAADRTVEVDAKDMPVVGPLLDALLPMPLAQGTFSRKWRAARAAAGLARLQLRDCRHVAVAAWLERGLSLHGAQAAAGHETAHMTLWYARRRRAKLPAMTVAGN